MKTFLIFKRGNSGEPTNTLMSTYEAEEKQDTVDYRNYLEAEPLAVHFELPVGLNKKAVKLDLVDDVWTVVEDADKAAELLNESRNLKLNQIRALRVPKLSRVDVLINETALGICAIPRQDLIDYRQSLLDITAPYKTNPELLDNLEDLESLFPEGIE